MQNLQHLFFDDLTLQCLVQLTMIHDEILASVHVGLLAPPSVKKQSVSQDVCIAAGMIGGLTIFVYTRRN